MELGELPRARAVAGAESHLVDLQVINTSQLEVQNPRVANSHSRSCVGTKRHVCTLVTSPARCNTSIPFIDILVLVHVQVHVHVVEPQQTR